MERRGKKAKEKEKKGKTRRGGKKARCNFRVENVVGLEAEPPHYERTAAVYYVLFLQVG